VEGDFNAHEALEAAKERSEHAREGPSRNILLVAALLAVIAAITSLFANQRATNALQAKNEAILDQARATDTWNLYEARSIKSRIYQAIIDASPALPAATRASLKATAKHEGRDQAKLQAQATGYAKAVEEDNVRSETLLRSHEILEAGVTFLEVAIAIVSIAGMTSSRLLFGAGLVVAVVGIGLAVYGFLPIRAG
jgi:hypothetical protein